MSTRRKLKFEMELISGGGHSEHLLYFFVVPPGFWAAGNSLTQALHLTWLFTRCLAEHGCLSWRWTSHLGRYLVRAPVNFTGEIGDRPSILWTR